MTSVCNSHDPNASDWFLRILRFPSFLLETKVCRYKESRSASFFLQNFVNQFCRFFQVGIVGLQNVVVNTTKTKELANRNFQNNCLVDDLYVHGLI